MKKSTFIVITIILILATLILGIFLYIRHERNYFINDVGAYDIDDFKSYKKDFKTIAEAVVSFYDEEKENNDELIYIVIPNAPNDTWNLECVVGTEKTDRYTLSKKITEEEVQAYSCVQDAFAKTDSGGLWSIQVMNDRVVFSTQSPYAIIYMRNGKRPKYIFDENEIYDSMFVDRISWNWYQFKGKEVIY